MIEVCVILGSISLNLDKIVPGIETLNAIDLMEIEWNSWNDIQFGFHVEFFCSLKHLFSDKKSRF